MARPHLPPLRDRTHESFVQKIAYLSCAVWTGQQSCSVGRACQLACKSWLPPPHTHARGAVHAGMCGCKQAARSPPFLHRPSCPPAAHSPPHHTSVQLLRGRAQLPPPTAPHALLLLILPHSTFMLCTHAGTPPLRAAPTPSPPEHIHAVRTSWLACGPWSLGSRSSVQRAQVSSLAGSALRGCCQVLLVPSSLVTHPILRKE